MFLEIILTHECINILIGGSLITQWYTRGVNRLYWTKIHVQIVPERKWNNFVSNDYLFIKKKNQIETGDFRARNINL